MALIVIVVQNFNTAKYFYGIFLKTIHYRHKTMYFETNLINNFKEFNAKNYAVIVLQRYIFYFHNYFE